jgi:hypothetical protein
MPDVLTTAIIHRSKRLGTRPASRWQLTRRQKRDNGEGAHFRPEPLVGDHAKGLGRRQGLKRGLDFSISVIRHPPHVG